MCLYQCHKDSAVSISKKETCLYASVQSYLIIQFRQSPRECIAQSLEGSHTGSDGCATAWSVCCYHCPAVRSYTTLLKGLRVLLLPTVLTITSFQLVYQLLHHPAVIHLLHMSIPVNLNCSELTSVLMSQDPAAVDLVLPLDAKYDL